MPPRHNQPQQQPQQQPQRQNDMSPAQYKNEVKKLKNRYRAIYLCLAIVLGPMCYANLSYYFHVKVFFL